MSNGALTNLLILDTSSSVAEVDVCMYVCRLRISSSKIPLNPEKSQPLLARIDQQVEMQQVGLLVADVV